MTYSPTQSPITNYHYQLAHIQAMDKNEVEDSPPMMLVATNSYIIRKRYDMVYSHWFIHNYQIPNGRHVAYAKFVRM